jgi:hypothetical protein
VQLRVRGGKVLLHLGPKLRSPLVPRPLHPLLHQGLLGALTEAAAR